MTVSVRLFSPSFYPNIRPSEIEHTCNTVNNKPVEQNQFFRFTNVSSIRSAAAIWCNYHQPVTNQASLPGSCLRTHSVHLLIKRQMAHRLLNWKGCKKRPNLSYYLGIFEGILRKFTQSSV